MLRRRPLVGPDGTRRVPGLLSLANRLLRPLGLDHVGAVERIETLPGFSEEHRLREGQPEGAAGLLVQALLKGIDGAVVIADAQTLGAYQVANPGCRSD